jgi:hypothetical protein
VQVDDKKLVWLVSWPRCGNTLLRTILFQCFGLKTASVYEENNWKPEVRERCGLALLDEVATQQIHPVKTHSLPLPTCTSGRHIYVMRDGREATVSYWEYHKRITELRNYIVGNTRYGSWSQHFEEWMTFWAATPERHPLVLRYEDIVRGLHGRQHVIWALAQFLDIQPKTWQWDGFDAMHAIDPEFFRWGTNDSWKALLTGEDLSLFDELHGPMMAHLGYCEQKRDTRTGGNERD